MKQRATEKGYNFAYLHDPSQAVGRAYGASVTPQAFVLSSDRRIALYKTPIDDSPLDVDGIKQAYLRNAVEALLAGKTPATTENAPKAAALITSSRARRRRVFHTDARDCNPRVSGPTQIPRRMH